MAVFKARAPIQSIPATMPAPSSKQASSIAAPSMSLDTAKQTFALAPPARKRSVSKDSKPSGGTTTQPTQNSNEPSGELLQRHDSYAGVSKNSKPSGGTATQPTQNSNESSGELLQRHYSYVGVSDNSKPSGGTATQHTQNSNESSGELLQRYEITGVKFGVGKHSDVVQVRSKANGQTYAAKIMSCLTSSEAKIEREIRTMATFRHQSSTQMVDNLRCSEPLPVNVKAPYRCIVMKEIHGEPLTAILLRGGASPSLASKMLLQIASVLKEMHKKELVHRDVWSENILVDRNGDYFLIDFGSADSSVCLSDVAKKEGVNLPYLSPQICMQRPPAPSDDMWALGLVVTEMVTGKHVIRRMGSNEQPFFMLKDLFQKALEETVAASPQIGNIAKRLLAEHSRERATARDVIAMVSSGQHTSPQTPRGANSAPEMKLGKAVLYQARSNNSKYKGVIIGRSPNTPVWLVQLGENPNEIREVADIEIWRLTPLP